MMRTKSKKQIRVQSVRNPEADSFRYDMNRSIVDNKEREQLSRRPIAIIQQPSRILAEACFTCG